MLLGDFRASSNRLSCLKTCLFKNNLFEMTCCHKIIYFNSLTNQFQFSNLLITVHLAVVPTKASINIKVVVSTDCYYVARAVQLELISMFFDTLSKSLQWRNILVAVEFCSKGSLKDIRHLSSVFSSYIASRSIKVFSKPFWRCPHFLLNLELNLKELFFYWNLLYQKKVLKIRSF